MKYSLIIFLMILLSCHKESKIDDFEYSIEGDWKFTNAETILENGNYVNLIGGVNLHFRSDGKLYHSTLYVATPYLVGTYKRTDDITIDLTSNNSSNETITWKIITLNDSLLTLENKTNIRDTLCYTSSGPCYAISKATVHYKKF